MLLLKTPQFSLYVAVSIRATWIVVRLFSGVFIFAGGSYGMELFNYSICAYKMNRFGLKIMNSTNLRRFAISLIFWNVMHMKKIFLFAKYRQWKINESWNRVGTPQILIKNKTKMELQSLSFPAIGDDVCGASKHCRSFAFICCIFIFSPFIRWQ